MQQLRLAARNLTQLGLYREFEGRVFDILHKLGKSPMFWNSVYDANITSNPAVQGIHEFRQGRDDGRQLVVVANGKIYRTEDTEVTSSSPTITAGAQYLWSFANHQSLMYAAGGASGDDIWTWDGNTSNAATARLAGLGLRPKYVFAKFGVLFLAGFQTGTDFFNNPLVARYSNYGETTTDETRRRRTVGGERTT